MQDFFGNGSERLILSKRNNEHPFSLRHSWKFANSYLPKMLKTSVFDFLISERKTNICYLLVKEEMDLKDTVWAKYWYYIKFRKTLNPRTGKISEMKVFRNGWALTLEVYNGVLLFLIGWQKETWLLKWMPLIYEMSVKFIPAVVVYFHQWEKSLS